MLTNFSDDPVQGWMDKQIKKNRWMLAKTLPQCHWDWASVKIKNDTVCLEMWHYICILLWAKQASVTRLLGWHDPRCLDTHVWSGQWLETITSPGGLGWCLQRPHTDVREKKVQCVASSNTTLFLLLLLYRSPDHFCNKQSHCPITKSLVLSSCVLPTMQTSWPHV